MNTTRKESALYQLHVFNDVIPRSIMGMYTEEASSLRNSLSAVKSGGERKIPLKQTTK
jgi:hypothetical protein